jgi:hypothetical protein
VHQVAQKSTNTGNEDLMTSLSKLLSVTTMMFWLAMVGSFTTVTRVAGG